MANIEKRVSPAEQDQEDDWTLNTDQMIFMLQYHNPVEAAYASDDVAYLRQLESSDEYKALFDQMSWDEAYDRYEESLMTGKNEQSSLVPPSN
jgi:hypothetical protein